MRCGTPPIIYVGPTVSLDTTLKLLPYAETRPPVGRGDLYRDREAGFSQFVIIDGSFAQRDAVSPREVIDVAKDGALVIGASSMGALRAAECWPVGVHGVGVVFRAFRLGVLNSDDEVAVAMNPEDFTAMSIALVNIRFAVRRAVRKRLLDKEAASNVIEAASDTFYAERQWAHILYSAGVRDSSGELRRFLALHDVKRKDALSAFDYLRSAISRPMVSLTVQTKTNFSRLNRERFDPHFGLAIEETRVQLTEWLFGTGRYNRYVWPLVAGHAAFNSSSTGSLAARHRETLCELLTDALPPNDEFRSHLWNELEFNGELEAEIARMFAARRLAHDAVLRGVVIDPGVLARVRDEIGIEHEAYNWRSLIDNVVDGRLCGAIPFDWIERSCHEIALARSYIAIRRREAG